MTRILAAVLLLAACAPTRVVERPIMAPVDRAQVPKGADVACGPLDWSPIVLPTTEAAQIDGRQADRALAKAVLAECDRRRSAAVRAIRRR